MSEFVNLSRTVALVRRHCLSAFAHGCPIFLSPKENKPNGYVPMTEVPGQDKMRNRSQHNDFGVKLYVIKPSLEITGFAS